jgi:hypothetical protein
VLGIVLALRLVGARPILLPLIVLAASAVGFLLVGALGLPLLQRYLLVPAVLLCVFAGVAGAILIATALGRPGFGVTPGLAEMHRYDLGPAPELLSPEDRAAVGELAANINFSHWVVVDELPSRATASPLVRGLALACVAVGVLGVAGYLVLKADSFRIVGQGVLREARWQRQATQLVEDRRLAPYERCGVITMPTYRFVPELTLRAGLRAGRVVSRATQLGGAGPQRTGVAIVIGGDHADKTRLGWAAGVPRTTNRIPPGFHALASRGPFTAAVPDQGGECSITRLGTPDDSGGFDPAPVLGG